MKRRRVLCTVKELDVGENMGHICRSSTVEDLLLNLFVGYLLYHSYGSTDNRLLWKGRLVLQASANLYVVPFPLNSMVWDCLFASEYGRNESHVCSDSTLGLLYVVAFRQAGGILHSDNDVSGW